MYIRLDFVITNRHFYLLNCLAPRDVRLGPVLPLFAAVLITAYELMRPCCRGYIHFACGVTNTSNWSLGWRLDIRVGPLLLLFIPCCVISPYDRLAFAIGGYISFFLCWSGGGKLRFLEHWISLGLKVVKQHGGGGIRTVGFLEDEGWLLFLTLFPIARYAHTQTRPASCFHFEAAGYERLLSQHWRSSFVRAILMFVLFPLPSHLRNQLFYYTFVVGLRPLLPRAVSLVGDWLGLAFVRSSLGLLLMVIRLIDRWGVGREGGFGSSDITSSPTLHLFCAEDCSLL